jgi:molybdate transport system permease protein
MLVSRPTNVSSCWSSKRESNSRNALLILQAWVQSPVSPACEPRIIGPSMQIDWFPLWLSLRVAILSTALALAGGLWLAHLLANHEFRGKDALDAAITLPLVLPPTVLGYYLLIVIGRSHAFGKLWEEIFGSPLVFTWKAAVLAALLHSLPLLVKSARAAFESVDRRYERAARNLGASEWRVFWRVTIPLARRSVMAAAALAFARSLGDFGVTLMVAGNIPGKTQTVAVAIYDAVEAGNGALARTLVLVISAIALVILTVANRLSPR